MLKPVFTGMVGISIFFMCLHCSPNKNTESFRYDTYKATITDQGVTDMGLLKNGGSNPVSLVRNIDAYTIDNYAAFAQAYGSSKDSIGIDSSLFNQNRLISFFQTAFGGDQIDSYTFYTSTDTLFLTCKIKLWDNKTSSVRLASPFAITFKVHK